MISLEAEQAVIGGLFLKPELIDDVIEILNHTDFSDIAHGILFNIISKCDVKEIDVITVSEQLHERGLIEQVGGMTYLSEIIKNTPSSANINAYARIVKERSNLRNLTQKLTDAKLNVEESKDYNDAVAKVNAMLSDIEVSTSDYVTFDKILKDRFEDLDKRFKRGGGIDGISTGFNKLDNVTLGLKGGDLFIIGARPSMGKTAFSLALANNIAKKEGDVLYFSVESTKESLATRMIAASGGIDMTKIKTARIDDGDWPKLISSASYLKKLPIHFIDVSAIDVSHAAAIARKFNRKKKLKAIFVDYIQLMTAKGCNGEYETVSHVSRSLKAIAKECDAPVIALAQLNRELEKRPNKRPNLSDLRATGQIEQDGDIILFLYRDEYYNKDTCDKNITEASIQKNRDGFTDDLFFSSDLARMQYKEIDYTPAPKETYRPFAK